MTTVFNLMRTYEHMEEHRMSQNGLTILLAPVASVSATLVMVTYHVGASDEPPDAAGCSHMLEHMMFKGSTHFNEACGTSLHEVLGAAGGSANATTWLDHTNYWCIVPTTHWELALEIEADRMQGLLLSAADLEVERKVVLNEHDTRLESPLEFLHQATWGAVYRNHAYGRPVIGTPASISNFTREQLLDYYKMYYRPSNATVTVVGDFDHGDVLEKISSQFREMQPDKAPCRTSDKYIFDGDISQEVAISRPGAPACLVLAYPSPSGLETDTDALALLAVILCNGKSSRLGLELIAAGSASHVWASTSRLRQHGLFQIHVLLGRADLRVAASVSKHIQKSIEEIQRNGVSSDEIKRAKGFARGQLLTSRDGILSVAMQLNEAIAMGDWRFYMDAIKRFDAVSSDDIRRVARVWLDDQRRTAVLMTGAKETVHDGP